MREDIEKKIVEEMNNHVAGIRKNTQTERKEYVFPSLDLLNPIERTNRHQIDPEIKNRCNTVEKTLADFSVNAKVTNVIRGPSVTRYELEPAPGIKISSVVNLADDIALRLALPGVRMEAPVPGKAVIGLEVPDMKKELVSFREIVNCEEVRENPSRLCVGLGKDIEGKAVAIDLARMSHLLIAGMSGSGKSVCVNTLLAGIMYKARPDEVKLILMNPGLVDFSGYNGIPHLLAPVITDAIKAGEALQWAVTEMERRYKAFAYTRVRNITAYNARAEVRMPYIVIVIDEICDLMMAARLDVEDAILRLARKARACGIHMVLATQCSSVDVITGIVKKNIPSRIAFAVSSLNESLTLLDMGGAEKLLGKGDMLYYPIGANKPLRVQGAFISDEELDRVTDFIKQQVIPVEDNPEILGMVLPGDSRKEETIFVPCVGAVQKDSDQDELLDYAINLVLNLGKVSVSMLQRLFRISHNRAARLVEAMEELGIIGPAIGSKLRESVLSREETEDVKGDSYPDVPPVKIKVVGVGCGGICCINSMVSCGVQGVELIAVDCDAQVLRSSRVQNRIQIGRQLTEGLGAGSHPAIGWAAAVRSRNILTEQFKDADIVFVVAGMGGGTGSGAAPVVAECAREAGALTVGFVAKPFNFEGRHRMSLAETGINNMKDCVDALITISNDQLLQTAETKVNSPVLFQSAFADELRLGIQGITDIIAVPGLINAGVDDVKTILKNAGAVSMVIGTAKGDDAYKKAANRANRKGTNKGARSVLVNITGGKDLSLYDATRALDIIIEGAAVDASVVFGVIIDDKMEDDEVRVSCYFIPGASC